MPSLKRIVLVIGLPLLLMPTHCRVDQPPVADGPVDYMVPGYYFLVNTYTAPLDTSFLVLTSYHAFDSLFQVGAVMGMDTSKLVTESKMTGGVVVAAIYHGNDIRSFTLDSIRAESGELVVYYSSSVTTPNATWTCNCFMAALVYASPVPTVRFVENGTSLTGITVRYL